MGLFDKITEAMTNPGALQQAQVPALIAKGKQAAESDPESAIKFLSMATTIASDSVDAWTALADVYSDSNRPDSAVEAYSKVIELNPGSPDAYVAMGAELLSLERYAEAQNALMHGLLLEDDADSSDFYNLALAFYHQDKPGQAVAFCQRALNKGSDTDAEQLLGDCHYDLDCYGDAVEHYRAALLIDPSNVHCLSNLGFALELSDRPQEAIEALKSASDNGAKDAEVYGSLSRCYERAGDDQRAQEMAAKYYELKPQAEERS